MPKRYTWALKRPIHEVILLRMARGEWAALVPADICRLSYALYGWRSASHRAEDTVWQREYFRAGTQTNRRRLFGQCQSHAVIHGHAELHISSAPMPLLDCVNRPLRQWRLEIEIFRPLAIQQNLMNRTLIRALAHYLASREDQTIFYQKCLVASRAAKSSVCRFFGTEGTIRSSSALNGSRVATLWHHNAPTLH